MKRTCLRLCVMLAAVMGASSAVLAADTNVTGYHGGGRRPGLYVVPGLTAPVAAATTLDTAFDGKVPGKIYAQPLYWVPQGADHGQIIVATEENVVTALDSETGKPVWSRTLGTPVPASSLECGNIDPDGITGTPVIDPSAGVLYVDSLQMKSGAPEHVVYALSLADGSVVNGWPVVLSQQLHGQGFSSEIEEERGALELFGGTLYVPFAGNSGDCGPYHGWVVGLNSSDATLYGFWRTTARRGGIWAQGAISDDGTSIFTATGNTLGATSWSDGEAVIRLQPGLQHSSDTHDYFAPSNWAWLDAHDDDVGSTGPLPIDLPTAGSTPQPIILQMGKSGYAYVLDRTNLGGIGNPLVQAQIVAGRITTGPAVYPSGNGMAVALIGFGPACPQSSSNSTLLAIELRAGTPPALSVTWCVPFNGRGAPIVTTSNGTSDPIVWVVGALGDDRLHAYRGDTGATVFTSAASPALGNSAPFTTPIVAEGRLYYGTVGRIRAFVLGGKQASGSSR
jgi:outer membrane protein assembly factor BamB